MPYDKITSGKDKGKYRSKKSGKLRSLSSIRAEHAKKPKKYAHGGKVCKGMGAAQRGGKFSRNG